VCTVGGGPYGQALAAPFPLVAGGAPACLVHRLGAGGVHGTANAQTGAIDVVANVTASITGGESGRICPRCSGSAPGEVGTCDGGDFAGSACVVDDVVSVPTSAGDDVYPVSRTCLPTGVTLATVTVDLPLTTGPSMLDPAACPSSDDVRRDGTAVAPAPAWPGPEYPKSASGAVLAGTACAPATATAIDVALGLPGPAAVLLPVAESWLE
jgi:hypothetical protein